MWQKMFRYFKGIGSTMIALTVFNLAGCSTGYVGYVGEKRSDIYYASLNSEDFHKEITRLKGIAYGKSSPEDTADAHLRLALLYMDYRNPDRSYGDAIRELELYLSNPDAAGDGGKTIYARNLLTILAKLIELKDAQKRLNKLAEDLNKDKQNAKEEIDRLRQEIKDMTRRVKRLESENRALKEKIEKLKSLDLQLEKERSKIK